MACEAWQQIKVSQMYTCTFTLASASFQERMMLLASFSGLPHLQFLILACIVLASFSGDLPAFASNGLISGHHDGKDLIAFFQVKMYACMYDCIIMVHLWAAYLLVTLH